MKYFIVPTILLTMATVALAGLKIPRSVYRMDKLDEAVAKAKKDGKALAFVLTEEGST